MDSLNRAFSCLQVSGSDGRAVLNTKLKKNRVSIGLSETDSPDYLIVGHVAKDKGPQGVLLGGTCSYSGLTAQRLGQRTAAVTSYGPDIPSLALLAGVQIENVPCQFSTIFENIYGAGHRRQKWSATAAMLLAEHVPPVWRRAPIVHLAPIAQEISPAMCGRFKDSLLCVTAQGWLRGQDADGNVICRQHPELEAWLPKIDVLVFSRSDLFDRRSDLVPLLTSAGLVVETLGPQGCNVYHKGRVTLVSVKPEVEVDPTGAGDIFAAAFFVRYHEGSDAIEAARFANACASLSVRETGLKSVPGRPAVEAHQAALYGC